MAMGEAPGEDEGEERAKRVGGTGLGFLSRSMSLSRYSSFRGSEEGALWTSQGPPKEELAFLSHFKWRAAERHKRGNKKEVSKKF